MSSWERGTGTALHGALCRGDGARTCCRRWRWPPGTRPAPRRPQLSPRSGAAAPATPTCTRLCGTGREQEERKGRGGRERSDETEQH